MYSDSGSHREEQLRKTALPDFKVGDTVKVSVLIKEGEKERAQAFEGVVIKKTGAGMRASFTVARSATASASSAFSRRTRRASRRST